LAFIAALFRSRASLHLENLALRHQVAVYKQTVRRPWLRPTDRIVCAWLSRLWSGWQDALTFVQPGTVIAWQRRRFREHWRGLSQNGAYFRRRVRNMRLEEVVIAPRCPWQNPYVERLIGSIRREVLDQVIILNEQHLKRILASYFGYYHAWRTHLSLAMDCPEPRAIQPPERGRVIALPDVGGLHHHYERQAA
jgi:hypothetical protein